VPSEARDRVAVSDAAGSDDELSGGDLGRPRSCVSQSGTDHAPQRRTCMARAEAKDAERSLDRHPEDVVDGTERLCLRDPRPACAGRYELHRRRASTGAAQNDVPVK
jgi:hypothetical protein